MSVLDSRWKHFRKQSGNNPCKVAAKGGEMGQPEGLAYKKQNCQNPTHPAGRVRPFGAAARNSDLSILNPNQNSMKTKYLFSLCFIILHSSFCLPAFAQGTAFTYQGRLNDGANPASGIYDLRFEIYDTLSGGTRQGGTLTNAATGVSNGLFTVTLDFGNQFPGADRWLEIGVRTNGVGNFTALAPRQQITPSPYAIYSGSVNASGISGTIAPANIANGTITGPMLANGAVGSSQLAAGAVTTAALADGVVTGAKIFSPFNLLSTLALTNPTPLALDQFGVAVAAVGTDKILVGASFDDAGSNNAGAAHLFDAAGNLLVTLTNPSPAADDNFGFSVSGLGPDRLLVGAPSDDTGALNTGSAFVFSTGGALLLAITNPSPAVADGFGYSVAAVGSGGFLIGSIRDNPGGGQFGAAYLYNSSGNLVQTFTNPTPANLDLFGVALAGVGSDKLLVGASSDDTGAANAGSAYLYNTNGTLLITISNPSPAVGDGFGESLTAVGNDKFLIGAPADDTGATDAGAAYLYDLSGTLLQTFTNPAPTASDQFGRTLTAVGANRVLIGTPADEAANFGTAYLFDLSGKLLLTLTNPAPASGDQFATALAALDENRLIIGTLQADFGVANAGGVYLLSVDQFTPGLAADGVRFGGVNSASLADAAVTSAKLANAAVNSGSIADGTVTTADLDPTLLSNTFWLLGGNAGVNPAVDFVGTTDLVPLAFRAGNREVMRMEGQASGYRIIAGVNNAVSSATTNSAILGGRDGVIEANAPESTIVGGVDNAIRSKQRGTFIGGGARNEILLDNDYAVIVGGRDNRIGTNTVISLVVGGAENRIADNVDGGLMVGGFRNDILGSHNPNRREIAPVLIGGSDNEIGLESSWTVILGGDNNRIGTNCASAVIAGGTNNMVADNCGFSFAAGRRSRVNHVGAFVWADSQNANFASAGDNTFNVRAEGGVHLNDDTSQFFGSTTRQMINLYGTTYGIGVQSGTEYFRSNTRFSWFLDGTHSNTQNDPGAGGTVIMTLTSSGLTVNGVFVSSSDRNVKFGFAPVDPKEVLEKVATLPITRWHFTNDLSTAHIGPVAQDFYAAFGVGPDDKHIATVDADGVALAAIQGLNQKMEAGSQRSEDRMQKLETENAELKQRLEKLERLMSETSGGAK
jgi:hypothetical protein